MKIISTLLLALVSIQTIAESCKVFNDPNTELNIVIRELTSNKKNTKTLALLFNGFSANTSNACGATLLHIAAIMNDVELTEVLINKGANPNKQNHEGHTPVFLAANWSSNAILSILLKAGGDPNVIVDQTSLYNTPLTIAAINQNIKGVNFLIQAGANPDYVNPKGISAVSIANKLKNEDLKKALYKNQH